MAVDPVPGEPAALAETDGERLLLLADYHAGIELGLRREGVELRSRADERREHLSAIVESTDPDRLVVLGDLGHAIGDPYGDERGELTELLGAVERPVTVAKGNHDGDIEHLLESVAADLAHPIELTPSHGAVLGDIGVVHGHTWPSPAVLAADTVCIGHEHPVVRLEDEVGGHRKERVWLRGDLDPAGFADHYDDALDVDGELVVFPAFNDLSGGTWINVEGQSFLAPFLPEGLSNAEAYLLDGTRLGDYRGV